MHIIIFNQQQVQYYNRLAQRYIYNREPMQKKQQKAYIAGKTKFKHFPIKQQVLALLQAENFKKPTLVQADSMPITLQQNLKQLCVIVYAYNGSGKTLTYLIPILNSLQMIPHQGTIKGRKPQALIVFPTEALMSQVYEYLSSYANFYQMTYKWPLKIGRIYSNILQYGHIIVGLTKKICDNLVNFDLSQLKWVAFDECDKIKEDSREIFQQILKQFSKNKNSANFLITSATGDKKNFRQFIQQNLTTHNVVQLDSKDENMGLIGVTHYYSKLSGKDKINSIMQILAQLASKEQKIQVIIFFNQIRQLQAFYQLLKNQKDLFVVNDSQATSKGKNNLSVDYIHARVGVHKNQHNCPEDCSRSKTNRVARLRNGQIQVLLGTQTIGRGIDIRTVSLVINFSQAKKNKQQMSSVVYIHRVGRTGRYSDEGVALTFLQEKTGDLFIKLVENEQKVKFNKMESEQKLLQQALICSKKNVQLGEDSKHRYQAS